MTKAEEILKMVQNNPKHEMADCFNDRTEGMVLDAINIALNMPVVSNNEVAVCLKGYQFGAYECKFCKAKYSQYCTKKQTDC